MRTPIRLAAVFGLIATLLFAAPVGAVKFGQPDAEEHPYVGELLFYVPDAPSSLFDDPGGWFSCTGTLVSPTVILTAGHCTFAVGLDGESTTNDGEWTTAEDGHGSGGNDIWVDFSEVAHFDGFPPSSDYERDENQQRYEDRRDFLNDSEFWLRGTAYPHPEYDDNAFYVHDAGVVVLDDPVGMDTYGEIATEGYADRYTSTRRNTHLFEVVGYGLEKALPFSSEGGDIRLKAHVQFITARGSSPKNTYLLVSNNPGNKATGGTCFGDSGGPLLDNTNSNLILAVNSFAFSDTCSGASGVYRIDQPDDLEFLAGFGITP